MYGSPYSSVEMSVLTDRLIVVKEQVARLVREQAELRQLLSLRESEAGEQERIRTMLKERIAELEKENEVLRNAKPAPARQETPGTKERIDEVVAEIDRCLELLNP
jgi:predicted nuclease of restriction endonuclease-like (RecB) superfamily